MKKYLLLVIILLFSTNSYSAPPTRQFNYVPNTLIDPAQNNSNENALYSYLQVGVDTYAMGSITGDDISSVAAIAYSKLALTNSIVNADIFSSAGIVDTKLAQITTASKVSGSAITGLSSIPSGAGQLAVVNGGTGNDWSAIPQGSLPYFNSTGVITTAPPGTNGQVYTTQGAGANPYWGNALSSVSDYGTSSSASTARQATALKVAYGHDISVAGGGSQSVTNLGFTSSSSYTVVCSANSSFGAPPGATDQSAGNLACNPGSGSSFTIYNTDDQTKTVAWIAMGI